MYDNAGVPCFHFHISLLLCPLARCNCLNTARLRCNTYTKRSTGEEEATSHPPSRHCLTFKEAIADMSWQKSDRDLCLYKSKRGREPGRGETKWQEGMFSIHEQRLASGWSHRRGGGFAECALGILIHGHISPPFSLFCMPPHNPKTSADTTLGSLQTQHNKTTFSTSGVNQCGRSMC